MQYILNTKLGRVEQDSLYGGKFSDGKIFGNANILELNFRNYENFIFNF